MPSSLHLRKISLGERLPTEIDIKLRNVVPPPNIYNLDLAGNASSGKYISSRYKYFYLLSRNARKILLFGRDSNGFDNNLHSFSVGPGSCKLYEENRFNYKRIFIRLN
jgi:hypothetical protein